jgi:glycosyltransferase involved in cell wall biosynthesis
MIFIFTTEPFPHGFAATNRIISYATGFLHHHEEVQVICIRKTEKEGKIANREVHGKYRDVPFRYLSGTTIKSGSLVIRKMNDLLLNLKLLFFGLKHLDRSTCSIYYSPLTSPALILRIASWIKRSKIFKEENEHPSVRIVNRNKLEVFFFLKLHYSLFDGMLLMTRFLMQYFKETRHYRKPLLHVPMTVDLERFRLNNRSTLKTIVYCGELDAEKDGILILIQAFAKIQPAYPGYSLCLIGEANTREELLGFHQKVRELQVSEWVTFPGKISNDEIPSRLTEASVLVLPRPKSLQAQHGFPTKLGEYLATGNPVIATGVGEIPEYLTDGVNAFLAEPGDAGSLAGKFSELLNEPERSAMIGKKGREVALSCFNNINQTRDILNFFKKIT